MVKRPAWIGVGFALFVAGAGCAGAGGDGSASGGASAEARRGPSRESGQLIGIDPLASTATIALSASDACARAAAKLAVPIAVVEDFGVPRYPPVLSFPIAFSRDANITSMTGFLAATPDGRPLATQAEVLSRWGDGPGACAAPIRWGYVHVLGEVVPERRSYLQLTHDPRSNAAYGPAIRVEESDAALVIDTGPARFTLDRRKFSGFAKIELDTPNGRRVLSGGSALIFERDGARGGAAFGKTWSVEVERAGPLVATVAAKGTYAAPDGSKVFRYTVRLSFWAGSGAVLFDHTYYNGETTDITAHGGKNRARVDRLYLRVPLSFAANGGDRAAPEVIARANEKVHRLRPREVVSVEQDKRSPDRPNVVSSVRVGKENLELGTFADRPMIAAATRDAYAIATLGWMGPRDPQALRFDPKTNALEVDFQSEALFVGGARGVWSKAMLDFGSVVPDLALRGTQLYAHATRPLIGTPSTAYLNTTGARGALPSGELGGAFARFDEDVDRIHDTTALYLRRFRITGTQIWPDLARTACQGEGCAALERGYFEGGDANYWDWSLVELEQFLRTADPVFVHDFALPEAMTMAETISFRPDPGSASDRSSFGGMTPCYGSGRETEDGEWLEGLNHRTGVCPGDYSYNKVHHLAYLLTADRRFTDFFTQGAETAIRMYKDPRTTDPDKWLELSASRTTYQYLEPLLDAAELSRIGGDAANRRYRDTALAYFDHLAKHALERGHTCHLLGTRTDDPKIKGDCPSDQAWMLPVWIEWVARLARLYQHAPARAWLAEFAKMSAKRYTVRDDRGLPDLSQEQSSGGWRTMYRCLANARGVDDASCRKVTQIENEGRFYPNGLVAFLNAYGIVLDADPKDPAQICRWLPDAYATALERMDQLNGYVWGKELGQAFAFTQTTLGAIERCAAAR